MRILIVGDSFAHMYVEDDSWPVILGKKLNAEITVKAAAGMPLYYCYRQLKNLKQDYDYYIVLVSSFFRIYVTDLIGINLAQVDDDYVKKTERSVSIADFSEHYRRTAVARAVKQYYDELMDLDYLKDVHMMCYKEIKNLLADKNYTIMPCFWSDLSLIEGNPFNLSEITAIEDSYIGVDRIDELQPKRLNHLFPVNNHILAEHFAQLISKGYSHITIKDFQPPPEEYWK